MDSERALEGWLHMARARTDNPGAARDFDDALAEHFIACRNFAARPHDLSANIAWSNTRASMLKALEALASREDS